MFRAADLVLLTKMDLAPHLPDFQAGRAQQHLKQLAIAAPCTEISTLTGAGMSDWLAWLAKARDEHRRNLHAGNNRQPRVATDGALLHAPDHTGEPHHDH
jgi:hydrogenase nickel incorporation protein HypB